MRKITTSLPHNIASAFKALVLVFCLLLATNKVQAQATAIATTCAGVGATSTMTIGGCSTAALAVSGASSGVALSAPCAGTVFSEGWMQITNNGLQTLIITGVTGSLNSQLQLQLFSTCGGAPIICADATTTTGSQTEVLTTPAPLAVGNYLLRIVNVGTAVMTAAICVESNNVCNSITPLVSNNGCNVATIANQKIIGHSYFSTGLNPTNACGAACSSCPATVPTGTFRRERWYSYATPAAPAVQALSVSASNGGPTGNIVIQIFSGACGSFSQVACSNLYDNSLAQTEIATYAAAAAGTTYYIRILYYFASNANLPLSTLCVNTTCAGASTVGINSCLTGPPNITLNDASTGNIATICSGTFQREGWFSFTTTTAGNYTVGATSNSGTSNLQIQMLSGACTNLTPQTVPFGSTLTQMACSDLITTSSIQTEEVSVACAAATTYYARIINSNAISAPMDISKICVNQTPTNDACASAVNITTPTPGGACSVNQVAGTVGGGTPSAVADLALTTCSPVNATNEDVWYTFTTSALASQVYTITVNGMSDPAFQVFSTTPCAGVSAGTLITGGCVNVNGVGTATESGTFAIAAGVLTVGTPYWIRVFDAQTTIPTTTAFTICITSPPLNDICSGAFPLTANNTCVPFVPVSPQSSTVMSSTNSGIAAGSTGGCNITSPTDDVWYTFTSDATGNSQTVTVTATGFAPCFQVFTAAAITCGTIVPANSVSCSASSTVGTVGSPVTVTASFFITNSQTYYVRVYDYNGGSTVSTGLFDICLLHTPPLNDACSGAISLTPTVSCSPTAGNTAVATQSFNANCTPAGSTNDDVWYSFVATSNSHIVTVASGAGFDAAFEVFSVACGATSLVCANATGVLGTETTTLSGLTIAATYWVRVFDAGTGIAAGTSFTICITTPPANDPCSGAITLTSNILSSPVYTVGTFAGATLSQAATGGGCGGTPNEDVWYSFTASQATHIITVIGTGQDTVVVEVFSGNCLGLTPLGCQKATSAGGTATFSFSGFTPGFTYLVRVYDFSSNTANSNVFQIAVTHQLNDQCTLAIPVSCGLSYSGTTLGATTTNDPTAACGSNGAITTPGVWYRFIGIGGNVSLNTSVSQFGTRINIYTGTCPGGPWTCISAGQTAMGTGQSVTFNSIAGTTYWIFIYNSTGSSGTFTLAFTGCGGGVPNDQCATAIPVFCGVPVTTGLTTTGSTSTGDPTSATSCGLGITSPGVWFSFLGTGATVIANTCPYTFDTEIHIYTGPCGGPYTCITANDDAWMVCGLGSQVQFATVAGTTYWIFVNGWSTYTGNFNLSITCVAPPVNDLCVNAIPVVCGGTYPGSTILATNTSDYVGGLSPQCGLPFTWPYGGSTTAGVWYVYHSSTVATITAALCTSNYDNMINVFSGACGGPWTCVAGGDDECTGQVGTYGYASFTTAPCTDYYIFVNGYWGSVGTYTLAINGSGCSTTPANDLCANATVIPACNTTLTGTTYGATSTGDPLVSSCLPITAPGVWYVYTPNDMYYLQATLCGSSACGTYNNLINVYQGTSCASLTCVGGNNDSCGTNAQYNWFSSATPGINYYVFVQGVGGTQGAFTLGLNGVASTSGGITTPPCTPIVVLPIELVSFTGELEGKQNLLKWTTATETNNDYFTLEKSQDAVNFTGFKRIAGAGTSIFSIDYSAYDVSPYAEITYYRLKQTDYNGAFTYSNIIALSNSMNDLSVTNLRPNPTSSDIRFDLYSPLRGKATVQLMDYLGRMVSDELVNITEGNTAVDVKMSELPKGVYSLKVSFSSTGFVSITKVVKD